MYTETSSRICNEITMRTLIKNSKRKTPKNIRHF